MKRAKKVRLEMQMSGLETSRRAKLPPATVSQIENGRFIPYPKQLQRLAEALEWTGDPEQLLEDVAE